AVLDELPRLRPPKRVIGRDIAAINALLAAALLLTLHAGGLRDALVELALVDGRGPALPFFVARDRRRTDAVVDAPRRRLRRLRELVPEDPDEVVAAERHLNGVVVRAGVEARQLSTVVGRRGEPIARADQEDNRVLRRVLVAEVRDELVAALFDALEHRL